MSANRLGTFGGEVKKSVSATASSTQIVPVGELRQSCAAGHPRKVAIVGGGPSRRKAPYADPSWEIWGFSSRAWRYPRVTRWFEIHALTDLRQQLAGRRPGRRTFAGYMRFMASLNCPIYMQEPHPALPQSVPFPFEQILETFGPCFTSTVSYLVALAIVEEVDVIGLWGIDVRRKEYMRQKPALQYLLALARQRGIELKIARESALRVVDRPVYVTTRVLYAYDWRSPGAWWRARVRRRARRRQLGQS